jgi:hypothetical protein
LRCVQAWGVCRANAEFDAHHVWLVVKKHVGDQLGSAELATTRRWEDTGTLGSHARGSSLDDRCCLTFLHACVCLSDSWCCGQVV